LLPGYKSVDDLDEVKRFSMAWDKDISSKPGLTGTRMVESAEAGNLRGLYVMGENPLMSHPDLNHVRKVYNELDFLVVQDMFMTETAELADVILPAASFAEKDGTYTNTARRIQRIRKAMEPVGDSLPDWKILCMLSERMGYRMDYSSPAEIMDEIANMVHTYSGISYDRLEEGGLQWPCVQGDHSRGTGFLHESGFTRGVGRFHAVDYIPPDEVADQDFPYILNTGRILQHFHSGTMTRRSQVLESLAPECLIEVNPVDARKLGLWEWDEIEVESRRGKIRARISVSERSPKGSIFIPFHYAEAAANVLTNSALDPESKIPEFKVCAVRIWKV
jgi:predicted molibdopterin-dependent oxidoreductase YjgC